MISVISEQKNRRANALLSWINQFLFLRMMVPWVKEPSGQGMEKAIMAWGAAGTDSPSPLRISATVSL